MTSEKTDRDTSVTPEYVNQKMESVIAALCDTMGETEERMRNLEKQVYELTQELKDVKKDTS
tara:strand:- start:323 stop:508 length:186 start_codon:yes stop_codon:yes gene_type:complete